MKRSDGRENDQLRRINIQRGFMKYAEGSCLIELGNTKVICTATVDKSVPLFLRNSGKGWVTAEYRMLPRATHTRTFRDKISGRNMEVQRLIGRSLRSIIDLERLGERTIRIDCDVIQANGGTRTASIIGGFVALVDCLHKLYKQSLIKEVCINSFLGAISVGLFQGEHVLDLTYLEDSQAHVDMNIVMKSSGEFVEVQGAAEKGSFTEKDLSIFIKLAKKGINEIIEVLRELLKDILPDSNL